MAGVSGLYGLLNFIWQDKELSLMHDFAELVERSVTFTLGALSQVEMRLTDELQVSAATTLIKSLQMVRLQKAILAVGMFSMFEAILQDGLDCKDGFREAESILDSECDMSLKERFCHFRLAINVLKHGRGRSYDELIARTGKLPFRLKQPDENSFFEGDVSELSTLVEVDDEFVLNCARVLREVSESISRRTQISNAGACPSDNQ